MMYVEVLGRSSEVRTRQRIATEPFSIGRSYDNDLIIDDPFVAPHHLRIEYDSEGNLVVRDLGSRNGLYLLQPARRVETVTIGEDTRLRIGHTQIRFRDAGFPVGPELESRPDTQYWYGTYFYLAFAGASALLVADGYATVFEPAIGAQVLAAVVASLLGVFVWAGIWAFFGRMATHRAQFYRHGTIALLAVAGLLLTQELAGYVEFGLSTSAAGPLGLLAGAAIIGAALYGHIRLVSRTRARSAALTAVGIAAVFTGSFALMEYSSSIGYSQALDYARSLKAPAFQLVGAETAEAFFADAESLRTTLDALRDE
ncbi:MAG TPA: FHA domain-containing protein [Burkholderiales bacterium]|nr:FHA domain-containing protein [Burkholderiales bacterium]